MSNNSNSSNGRPQYPLRGYAQTSAGHNAEPTALPRSTATTRKPREPIPRSTPEPPGPIEPDCDFELQDYGDFDGEVSDAVTTPLPAAPKENEDETANLNHPAPEQALGIFGAEDWPEPATKKKHMRLAKAVNCNGMLSGR
jgi:hypothetical protein